MENEQRQSQENREIDTEKNFLKTFEENFKHYSYEKKKRTILLMLAISFIFGFIVKGCTSVSRKTYSELLTENQKIQQTLDDTKKEYDNYKTKMHPYELQQSSDAKVSKEKARVEAEEKATEEKATPTPVPTTTPTPRPQSTTKPTSSSTTSTSSGVMPKDYKPTGDEPTWVEVISYCEMQLPDVIGYDADISLYESDTKIIRTGLRYKIETKSLKLKSDKSYHKAIFIIQFDDDSYETYRIPTAEIDGVKFR